MGRAYTLEQIRKQFYAVHNDLNYYKFVEYILEAIPREGDVWQEEKWESFQTACIAILRIPEKYLQRILEYER